MVRPLILTVIESPYAGDVETNVAYARAAMADSLRRGEAPYASHLLYTQPGILDDKDPAQRELGIACGFEWARHAATQTAIYLDLGWSSGMLKGIEAAERHGRTIVVRYILKDGFRDLALPAKFQGRVWDVNAQKLKKAG